MSRIFSAVERAEQERAISAMAAQVVPGQFPGYRRPVVPPVRGAKVVTTALEPSITATVAVSSPANGAAAPSVSWDQAIARTAQELDGQDRRIAEQQHAHMQMQERLERIRLEAARLEQERAQTQGQLEQASQAVTELSRGRVVLARRLEALQQCRTLSASCRQAEETVRAHETRAVSAQEAQRRAASDEAAARQQAAEARQQLEQLRFQLARALALTGTTEASSNGEQTPS